MSKTTKKTPRTARKASAKIRYEASGRNLTSQAGLIPVIKFLDALGFTGLFRHHVDHERADNAQYQLVDAVFLVLVGLMGGARSISQCVVLWSDGVLQRVAGWLRIPDESTVGRLFKELGERHISELETAGSCGAQEGVGTCPTGRELTHCRSVPEMDRCRLQCQNRLRSSARHSEGLQSA